MTKLRVVTASALASIVVAVVSSILIHERVQAVPGLSDKETRQIRKIAYTQIRGDFWYYLRSRGSENLPWAIKQTVNNVPNHFDRSRRIQIGEISRNTDGSVTAQGLWDNKPSARVSLRKKGVNWSVELVEWPPPDIH